jgi:hypothetical protein
MHGGAPGPAPRCLRWFMVFALCALGSTVGCGPNLEEVVSEAELERDLSPAELDIDLLRAVAGRISNGDTASEVVRATEAVTRNTSQGPRRFSVDLACENGDVALWRSDPGTFKVVRRTFPGGLLGYIRPMLASQRVATAGALESELAQEPGCGRGPLSVRVGSHWAMFGTLDDQMRVTSMSQPIKMR